MRIGIRWWILVGVVYLVASWFSTGFNQSDEHFQILEFAGLHLGLNDPHDLAWEYHERMRPGIQPLIAYGVHRTMATVGCGDPFLVAWVLRLLSAAFSLGVTYLLFRVFRNRYGARRLGWWFFLFSFLLWFGVYNGIRFNSENWAANCFALALGLYWYWKKPGVGQYTVLGLLVGLAFLFRFQLAFMIAGWGLWLIFVARERGSRLAAFTFGGLAAAASGILIDYWFYDEWVFSAWNYFEQNILLDKASNFGIDPWWQYFEDLLIKGIPPFSLFYFATIVAFLWQQPKHPITWVSVPFLLVHLLVAHKELRFLYPLLPLLPIVLTEVLYQWENRRGDGIWQRPALRWFGRLFWGHNAILLLFICCWSILPEMSLYRTIYRNYQEPISLYGIARNPYQLALEVRYYRRPQLCVQEVSSTTSLPRYGQAPYLVAIDHKKIDQLTEVPGEHKLVYSSFPDWIWYFNFNNWLERSRWWYVYEIRPRE